MIGRAESESRPPPASLDQTSAADPHEKESDRAEAMLKMVKLDIAALEAAAQGT